MLEADVQLKKDTALYTSPQTAEGKKYWDKLYKKAEELYGYDNITIPTLTRPWIVPGEIIIRETPTNAYIYKATLKVMLEEDYLRREQKNIVGYPAKAGSVIETDNRAKELNRYSTELIRELIIPKLTKDINTTKRYAALRQVYYSLILAQWFKQKALRTEDRVQRTEKEKNEYINLINSGNLSGLTSKTLWSKNTYYQQYQKSFKDGEYNLKEPVRTPYGQSIRSYFSGGMMFDTQAISSAIALRITLVNQGKDIINILASSGMNNPFISAEFKGGIKNLTTNVSSSVIKKEKNILSSSLRRGNHKYVLVRGKEIAEPNKEIFYAEQKKDLIQENSLKQDIEDFKKAVNLWQGLNIIDTEEQEDSNKEMLTAYFLSLKTRYCCFLNNIGRWDQDYSVSVKTIETILLYLDLENFLLKTPLSEEIRAENIINREHSWDNFISAEEALCDFILGCHEEYHCIFQNNENITALLAKQVLNFYPCDFFAKDKNANSLYYRNKAGRAFRKLIDIQPRLKINLMPYMFMFLWVSNIEDERKEPFTDIFREFLDKQILYQELSHNNDNIGLMKVLRNIISIKDLEDRFLSEGLGNIPNIIYEHFCGNLSTEQEKVITRIYDELAPQSPELIDIMQMIAEQKIDKDRLVHTENGMITRWNYDLKHSCKIFQQNLEEMAAVLLEKDKSMQNFIIEVLLNLPLAWKPENFGLLWEHYGKNSGTLLAKEIFLLPDASQQADLLRFISGAPHIKDDFLKCAANIDNILLGENYFLDWEPESFRLLWEFYGKNLGELLVEQIFIIPDISQQTCLLQSINANQRIRNEFLLCAKKVFVREDKTLLQQHVFKIFNPEISRYYEKINKLCELLPPLLYAIPDVLAGSLNDKITATDGDLLQAIGSQPESETAKALYYLKTADIGDFPVNIETTPFLLRYCDYFIDVPNRYLFKEQAIHFIIKNSENSEYQNIFKNLPFNWLIQFKDKIPGEALFAAVRLAVRISAFNSEIEAKKFIYAYANQFFDQSEFKNEEKIETAGLTLLRFGDRNYIELIPKEKNGSVIPRFIIHKQFDPAQELNDEAKSGGKGFNAELSGLIA